MKRFMKDCIQSRANSPVSLSWAVILHMLSCQPTFPVQSSILQRDQNCCSKKSRLDFPARQKTYIALRLDPHTDEKGPVELIAAAHIMQFTGNLHVDYKESRYPAARSSTRPLRVIPKFKNSTYDNTLLLSRIHELFE